MRQFINGEYRDAEGIEIPDMPPDVAALKAALSETDYRIIKCMEYQLAGLEAPYDIAALHAERQAIRDQINELETGNEL